MTRAQCVAVIYDDRVRPDTTGVHCLEALSRITEVLHFYPEQLRDIDPRQFGLFLRIDDGNRIEWPVNLRPSACWLIDTHLGFEQRLDAANQFDFVFAAQRNGAQRFTSCGITQVEWLPLACNPYVHRRHAITNQWDIAFVGNCLAGNRESVFARLRRRFPRSYFGHAYGDALAQIYSSSFFAFNSAVADDVNMRVFEALACGTPLATNDQTANGQAELFHDGIHLITYVDVDDLIDKLDFYSRHPDSSTRIGEAGRQEVVRRHTYDHRMTRILEVTSYYNEKAHVTVGNIGQLTPASISQQVDIVVKTFLRPALLLQLLRSIRDYYPDVHVTVADDGGLEHATDRLSLQCMDLLRHDLGCTLVRLPFGSGVSAGRNALVENTSRPFMLFLDDDFRFTPATRIEDLLNRLLTDESVGVAAGVCVDVHGSSRQIRRSFGTLHVDGDVLFHNTNEWIEKSDGRCDYFPTFALFRRAVFDQVKWRGGIGGEHYDLCLQIQRSQWNAAILPDVQIDHSRDAEAAPSYWEYRLNYHEAQQELLRTWGLRKIDQDGQLVCALDEDVAHDAIARSVESVDNGCPLDQDSFDPIYYDFPRLDVLALIPLSARRILDVGCGSGRLGQAIMQRQGAEVVGIEVNPLAARLAKTRLTETHCMDAEAANWPFNGKEFDCVILGDVLEHLRFPEKLLESLHGCMREDGVLVASIPNVRNHSVVSALLDGNWTYEAAGLLDRTHLRFFTKREIEKLFYRQRFEISSIGAKLDLTVDNDFAKQRPTQVRLGSFVLDGLSDCEAEEFYTYQYLVSARPVRQCNYSLTSIIILTHNQLQCTRMCLDSIRMRTDEPYELIVVDNASGDGTVEYLESVPGVTLIKNDRNRGFPAGVNQGLQQSTGQQILLLNNDTIVTTGWLRRMLDCLYSDERNGLVGPVTNEVSGVQRIQASYTDLAQLDGFAWDWAKANASKQFESERLVGFCLLARRILVDRIGGLDERFGIGNYEDDDYCRRARQAGFRCLVAVDSYIHHFGSQTFLGSGIDANALLARNRALFNAKWGGPESVEFECDHSPKPGMHFDTKSTASGCVLLRTCDLTTRVSSIPGAESTDVDTGTYVNDTLSQNISEAGEENARSTKRNLEDVATGSASDCGAEPTSGLGRLRKQFLWPERSPIFDCRDAVEGWLADGARAVLEATINQNTDTVVELGSWMGLSSRFMVNCSRHVNVVAVDHFEGSQEHRRDPKLQRQISGLYSGFLSRCWHFRSRITPIQSDSSKGMELIAAAGVRADVVYFDAEHDTDLISRDLETACRLFPRAVLVGDDYQDPSVRAAVDTFAIRHCLVVEVFGVEWLAWRLAPYTLGDDTARVNRKVARLRDQSQTISLCMIARDNESTIAACLESIRPWVDEMIVVDTGSVDRTRAIARLCGAKIFEMPWPDSFSVARNESLSHANGDWIFWMDSDDTISNDNGHKLRSLLTEERSKELFGFVVQVHCPNCDADGANDVTIVDHIKLFRNRLNLRFSGRIHEQIMPAIRDAGGQVAWTDVFVTHSGSDQTAEGRRRKQQRDLKLLRLESRDSPDNSFVHFNLGMTFADMGDDTSAVTALERSIELSLPSESHLRKAYALLAASLCRKGEFHKADTVCRSGLALFVEDVELRFREGFVAHHLGHPDEAIAAYRAALACPDSREFGSVDRGLRGYKTRHNLALVYEDQAVFALAEEQWRLVVAEMPSYGEGWLGLARTLIRQGKLDQASQIADRLADGGLEVSKLRSLIAQQRGDLAEASEHLEEGLSKDATNRELLDQMCRLVFEQGTPDEAEAYLHRLVDLEPDNPAAWHNLGTTYLRQKRWQHAANSFQRAIRLRGSSAISYLYLGFALKEKGDLAAARSAWEDASRLDPADPAVREARERLSAHNALR